jgi:hypothetical protein
LKSTEGQHGKQSGLQARIVDDGKRFVVRADQKLTTFPELESAIRGSSSFTRSCTVQRDSAGTETYD